MFLASEQDCCQPASWAVECLASPRMASLRLNSFGMTFDGFRESLHARLREGKMALRLALVGVLQAAAQVLCHCKPSE